MGSIWPSLWPQFSGVLLAPTLILMVASQAAAQTDFSLAGFTFFQNLDSWTGSNLNCTYYNLALTLEAGLQDFKQHNAKDCLGNPECVATNFLASDPTQFSQSSCTKGALMPLTQQASAATAPCQGIYVKDTHYICYNWNANDLAWRGLGKDGATVCQSYLGFTFTGGSNTNYSGCGDCACCAPASIENTTLSSLGYAPVTLPPPSPPLPSSPSPSSPLLPPLPTPLRPPPPVSSPLSPEISSATSSTSPAVHAGVIVGAVVGVVLGVTALALLAWWLIKKKRSKPPPSDPSGHVEVALFSSTNPPTTESDPNGPSWSPPAPPKVPLDDRLSDLRIAWESIEIGAVLGSGGFADVYRGMWQENPVAVKMLNLQRLSANAQQELRKEALAMYKLPHPCIAQVYGLVDDGTHHALVMRYYKRGSVADVIAKSAYQQMDMSQRLKMAVQVASGMCYLHERRLIHGDLKTANLLIEDTGRGVVIADFGLSGVAGQAVASGAMTVSISPPEVLIDPRAPRTEAGDVYAFAIVLFEIATGYAAYRGMRPAQLKDVVISGRRPTVPEFVPDYVETIITACWSQEAAARPVFTEVLKRLVAATEACGPSGQQPGGPLRPHGSTTTATATHTMTLQDLTSTNML